MTAKGNPGGVADKVRNMDVGDIVVRAFRRPLADYRQEEAEEWRRGLNAQLTRLRGVTGFSLTTDSLPPTVVNDHVIRATVITRNA